jgi:hypothetical protein
MRKILAAIILALVASSAAAMKLDLNNPNGIAALYVTSDNGGISCALNYVVCTNGTGYMVPNHESGAWVAFNPSPVPLAEVVEWTPWTLYTTDGRWFVRTSAPDAWEQMGVDTGIPTPPCFVPVKTDQAPMGKVKALFR